MLTVESTGYLLGLVRQAARDRRDLHISYI